MEASSAASQTALMVCAFRARESRAARPLFVDPWAHALAGDEGEALAARLEERFPPMHLWLALRVAYLDRLVALAVDRLSVRQIVILGAGYDTRAARLPRADVTYFEVDHPATQAAKRARLAALPGYPVAAARYIACDFEHQDPIEQLVIGGFDVREPALVLWEGVVPYLTEAAVRATAARLALGLDRRSIVAFDFVGKKLVESPTLTEADLATRRYVGELGEPLRFGADDILPLCADAGFRWVRSLDFNQLALELRGDYVRARQFRFQHIALCSRSVPAIGWP
jgi:methyltransferase (TIGR00027 family)